MSEPKSFSMDEVREFQRRRNERLENFKASPRYQDFSEEMKSFEATILDQYHRTRTCQHADSGFDPDCPECKAAQERFHEAFRVKWEAICLAFPELDLKIDLPKNDESKSG
jgi:hypothetical protein